jgi:uncharacterized RDD family membrane protein YckC
MQQKKFTITNDLLASQGQRLGNYIIDLIFQYALIFALSIIAGIILGILGIDGFSEWADSIDRIEEYFFGAIIMVLYYSITESLFSRTIGKLITKTIVVDINGEKPASGIIIKRSFCRLIPFNHFSFLGGNTRGWHDSISNTYVVNEKLLQIKKDQFYALDEIGNSDI